MNQPSIELNFQRELTFCIRGETKKGLLQIFKVRPVEGRDRWECHWSLAYVHPEVGRIFGDDPLDAIFQCLDFIGNLITGSQKNGLRVWWQYEGDSCGLNFTEYPDVSSAGAESCD